MTQFEPQNNPKLPMQQQEAKSVPNFAGMMSAGNNIEQAARAVAAHRGGYSTGGGGDYGAGPGGSAVRMGPLEVLSDTQGVDFGPYLSRVVDAVRREWYTLIPEAARPPLLKRGRVAIEFAILKDGTIAGIKYSGDGHSGDISLDRAAWGGITGVRPSLPCPPSITRLTWHSASASTTTRKGRDRVRRPLAIRSWQLAKARKDGAYGRALASQTRN